MSSFNIQAFNIMILDSLVTSWRTNDSNSDHTFPVSPSLGASKQLGQLLLVAAFGHDIVVSGACRNFEWQDQN